MKIQLNTDTNIKGTEEQSMQISTMLEHSLARFSRQITRIEVHLSDVNSRKPGQQDQRCMLEARLEGRQPVAVTNHANTMDQAVRGAAHKLSRMLESTTGRLHDQHGRSPEPQAPDMPPTEL
jgi:ribosome-associated translation inhibitor RaiA